MFEHLRNRFAQWWTYRHTLEELSFQDARILRDVGIEYPSEGAIRALARRAAAEDHLNRSTKLKVVTSTSPISVSRNSGITGSATNMC